MEEDIRILEGIIQTYKDWNELPYKFNKEIIQAIENLIQRNKELEKIVKTYNAIPNDYMHNDVKIVIADREYFNNGILKENCIPKSKIKEILEHYKHTEIGDTDKLIEFYIKLQKLLDE